MKHIDTVRDDKDIENGDVDDDEDEVVEIKTPSPPSSSSSLNGAADAALKMSTEIHISDEFVQEQPGQKPPVQVPHDETGAWPTALHAIIVDPLYRALNTLAEKEDAWKKV